MQKLNKSIIKKQLLSQLESNKADLAEFNLLVKAAELNKWELNKRILKHLPDGCEYNTQYGMYHVIFPSKKSHLLGWQSSTTILSAESLRHSDSCHSNGSESRIMQLEGILKPENFDNYCKLFITLQKSVLSVISAMDAIKDNKMDAFYNPAYYELLNLAGMHYQAWNKLDDKRNGRD